MPFISVEFILFLLASMLVYYLLPSGRAQYFWLLAASLFYIGSYNSISVLAVSCMTGINFFLQAIYHKRKQAVFITALLLNASILLIYKIFQTSYGHSFALDGWILLGMGFYMLQFIGIWMDIHFRNTSPNNHLLSYSVGILFFSKIPSGPILSREDQLMKKGGLLKQELKSEDFWWGLQRILLGFAKKLILADRLLPFVNTVFDNGTAVNGLTIYMAPFLFTLQLYFDFSGYIDIALGAARWFGIRLPENFNVPLRSVSITDFWRRWHISLVNWLRNNVFLPTGFYFRYLKNGVFLSIAITFLVSAAWHGLSLMFFIWALFHFIYLAVEHKTRLSQISPQTPKWIKLLRIALVWHLVAIAHFFFRVKNLDQAGTLWDLLLNQNFFVPEGAHFSSWIINGGRYIETEFNFRVTLLLCVLFLLAEPWLNRKASSEKPQPFYLALIIFMICTLAIFNSGERFIYMQF